jgi:uncharacterized protein YicC (UPF0701 family)
MVREQLLAELVSRLQALRSSDGAQLQKALDEQIDKLAAEVKRRQNNKIITWRYMKKEVELLSRLKLWTADYDEFFSG